MKNLILAAILMIISTEARSQIYKNDPVNIPDGYKFKEIGVNEINDTISINMNKENLIMGYAQIDVSDLDRRAVKAIVDNAKYVREIIDILGGGILLGFVDNDGKSIQNNVYALGEGTLVESQSLGQETTTTISGFYYFIGREFDDSHSISLILVWPLKN